MDTTSNQLNWKCFVSLARVHRQICWRASRVANTAKSWAEKRNKFVIKIRCCCFRRALYAWCVCIFLEMRKSERRYTFDFYLLFFVRSERLLFHSNSFVSQFSNNCEDLPINVHDFFVFTIVNTSHAHCFDVSKVTVIKLSLQCIRSIWIRIFRSICTGHTQQIFLNIRQQSIVIHWNWISWI